eukprot:CAMPEP_0184236802 /NCGR_PEP_ID=MMETSP0976-20121227/26016_1 /TAXON_ID=483370 /ORGANISM="non described non described, Strain CCMP2097" /LENGTH=30 /DNA_ID= /DNA_START= /DNA_END= /DNA_ORIENTATION=
MRASRGAWAGADAAPVLDVIEQDDLLKIIL